MKLQKGVVFVDWDGTLSKARFWSHLDKELYERLQDTLFSGNNPLVHDWMMGKKSSETICGWLSAELNISSEFLLSELIKTCVSMTVREDAVAIIKQLREKASVVLITDNMDCFTRFTVQQPGLADLFDKIINSADAGRMKRDRDGEVFVEIAKAYNASLDQCHLIDDSDKTCQLFESIGGHAYQTTSLDRTAEFLQKIYQTM